MKHPVFTLHLTHHRLDADNSGTVNRKEVASGLKISLNLVLSEDQLDLLLLEFDKDGNGTITLLLIYDTSLSLSLRYMLLDV